MNLDFKIGFGPDGQLTSDWAPMHTAVRDMRVHYEKMRNDVQAQRDRSEMEALIKQEQLKEATERMRDSELLPDGMVDLISAQLNISAATQPHFPELPPLKSEEDFHRDLLGSVAMSRMHLFLHDNNLYDFAALIQHAFRITWSLPVEVDQPAVVIDGDFQETLIGPPAFAFMKYLYARGIFAAESAKVPCECASELRECDICGGIGWTIGKPDSANAVQPQATETVEGSANQRTFRGTGTRTDPYEEVL